MWWIAQGVGMIAMGICFLSFQGNSKKHILAYQIVSGIVFTIHYALLMMLGEHTITAIVLDIINTFKNVFFILEIDYGYKNPKTWKILEKIMIVILIAMYIVSGILTWQSFYDILPVIGMTLTTLALLVDDPRIIRSLYFQSSPCWLIYNIHNGGIAGIITEIFNLISLFIAFVRFDILKQENNKKMRP